MVPPKKPEWFQLTDGEAHNQPNRRKRFIKIVALTAPLVIVAGGVIVAQTGESGPADAVSQTPAPVKVVASQTSNPEPAATSNATDSTIRSLNGVNTPLVDTSESAKSLNLAIARLNQDVESLSKIISQRSN